LLSRYDFALCIHIHVLISGFPSLIFENPLCTLTSELNIVETALSITRDYSQAVNSLLVLLLYPCPYLPRTTLDARSLVYYQPSLEIDETPIIRGLGHVLKVMGEQHSA
jgi:hypothetical protein